MAPATAQVAPTCQGKIEDYSQAGINQRLTSDQKIEFYRQMVRIRRFEHEALKHYNAGKMGGFLHLYIGQESVAVGTVSLMGENDHVITAYRDHGHALAVGMGMNECMAELFGKVTGCSQGKGGSMHYFAPDKNYWGGHGIVGGQTPLGAGLAFALKYKGLEGAAMCFMGDGAVNQGAFHESLNLAALWNLPVVYIIENNGYSMGTSLERSSAHPGCLAQRAEGYGMEWDLIDGFDLYEVRARVDVALERARKEQRPSILEIRTYRYYGHSVADSRHKDGYRTKEEIQRYQRENDPILIWGERLKLEGIATEDFLLEIDKAARKEAQAAARFAEESEYPTMDDVFKHVYYEVDMNTESAQRGRHFFND